MKTIIVNTIGASGSGKTMLAKELDKLEINVIQSYTSRDPRYDGEWGHTFLKGPYIWDGEFLINPRSMSSFKKSNMIAYFQGYSSGTHYFATDEQVIKGRSNIYIVDSKGAEQVHEYYKDDEDVKVVTIYLQTDEVERFTRMELRGYENKLTLKDNIIEVRSRIEKDRDLFQKVKCDYTIDGNREIDLVVRDVLDIIMEI